MQKEYKTLRIISIVLYVIAIIALIGAYAYLVYAKTLPSKETESGWEALGAVILFVVLSEFAGAFTILGFVFALVGLIMCSKKVVIDGAMQPQGKPLAKKRFLFLTLFPIILIAIYFILLFVFSII